MSKKNKKVKVHTAKLECLADEYVIKTSQNFRGLTYGDIIIRWQRWLLSDDPDKYQYGDILFMRGSVGYHKSHSYYFKSSVEISEGMAILVPVVTTHYNIGETYKGVVINNEFYLSKAVREHVDAAGPFWATIECVDDNHKVFKLVPNLLLFRVETMPFELKVSEENPFLDKMDEPNIPGNYTALVGGYFVILRDLPASSYRIRFGGYGMDDFYTESLYEINITSKKVASKDVSGSKFTPNHLIYENRNVAKTTTKSF